MKMTKSEAGKLGIEALKRNLLEKYNQNPNYCTHCNNTLPYDKRKNKFCNHTCSAIYSNTNRGKNIKTEKIIKRTYNPIKIEKKNCIVCNNLVKTNRQIYCCKQCELYNKSSLKMEDFFEGKITYRGMLRKMLTKINGYNCSICGIEKWNNKSITLEVDHIDGIHTNNYPENLRLLCPNCHSQTDTYKTKNKGKGRKNRK